MSGYNAISVECLPVWEVLTQTKTLFRNIAKEALLKKASYEMALPPASLLTRGLLASDLGLESWVTPKLQAGERTKWVDCTMADNRYVAFTKLTIIGDSPVLSTMSIEIGCNTRGIFDLDELYAPLQTINRLSDIDCSKAMLYQFGSLENLNMQAYFPTCFVVPQDCLLNIYISAIQASPGEHLVLGGIVVEPQGKKISLSLKP